jgi:NAD(P)-dependent dehydrogenase (short-subunit alcohol dehydrogenase family)
MDGARLAISDIDPLGLDETASRARDFGAQIRADLLDVRDREAMLAYADAVVAEFGGVHLVINNAGVVHGGEFLGMSFEDIERVIDIDFWGVVNGTKAFLPHLIASGSVGRERSALVNISSLFGLVPMPGQSAYVAAKYAVRGFTESVRIEMLAGRSPVTVDLRAPGRGEDRDRAQRDIERGCRPERERRTVRSQAGQNDAGPGCATDPARRRQGSAAGAGRDRRLAAVPAGIGEQQGVAARRRVRGFSAGPGDRGPDRLMPNGRRW